MRRLGFTMIELVFVIVIMGILGKFGVEFLAQAYKSFIFSSINNTLQAESEMAVESIAARLQFRIKDSVIGRRHDDFTKFEAPAGIVAPLVPEDYDILEWVGTDIDGLRGSSTAVPNLPNWSGIIDLKNPITTSNSLLSPETNTSKLNTLIGILSPSGATVNNVAIYFVGSDSDIKTGYGWDGNAITNQNAVMHPIRQSTTVGITDRFIPVRGDNGVDNNFVGVDVFEYYQLAWTAYAVGIDDYNTGVNAGTNTGTLTLWYDYQPWEGEKYTNGTSSILMENVSTFQYKAVGSIIKIQVCVNSDVVEDYSLCKEKTIF